MSRREQGFFVAAALLALAALVAIPDAIAGDRTSVPLKNWGGFAEFRDAVYDDLERLVTAGLADRVLLNTRPLSRLEAARIVARAIAKIRDDMGDLNARRDLEPVLDRLMEEFKIELASLGVRTAEAAPAPGLVSFTPIDRAQTVLGHASGQFSLLNAQGRSFKRVINGRLTFAPFSFLELGASRTVLFDGGGPYLPLSKYPSAIFPFNASFGDDPARPEERTDTLFGLDADLRLRNVDRYFLPGRDLRLYGEFYWDDSCGECGPSSGVGHWFASNILPKGSTTGGVGGAHLMGLFGQDWLDWRFEYARTSRLSLNHAGFTSGYWTRGHVLSDFIGTDGRDYFARLAARVTPDVMLGLEVDRAIIGSTGRGFPGPQV